MGAICGLQAANRLLNGPDESACLYEEVHLKEHS